jgi:hypothetical protein
MKRVIDNRPLPLATRGGPESGSQDTTAAEDVIDPDNATKGAIAFSGIPLWGGVKASGCRDIADACLACLATQAWWSAAGPQGGAG